MSATTQGSLYEDNMSRCFLVAVDEGNELLYIPYAEGEPTNIPVFAVQVTDSGDIEVDV